ncbi:MAG: tetratricopeptide repeat protein [Oscillospiraceae bacterium]|nr:tetratricopeptide repeat protein [Oscillospiraceae bacterium]
MKARQIAYNSGKDLLEALSALCPALIPVHVGLAATELADDILSYIKDRKEAAQFKKQHKELFFNLVDELDIPVNGELGDYLCSVGLVSLARDNIVNGAHRETADSKTAYEVALLLWEQKFAGKRDAEQAKPLLNAYIEEIYKLCKEQLYDSFDDGFKAVLTKVNAQHKENMEGHATTQAELADIKGQLSKMNEYVQKLADEKEAKRPELPKDKPAPAALTYYDIAIDYYERGKYDEALNWQLKAVTEIENVLDADDVEVAGSYNFLGMIYDELDEYDRALEYYFKALAINGTEHPNTATNYNNIGNSYAHKGEYGKALEYYFKALAIFEKTLSTGYPDTAMSYVNIGNVYIETGKYDKALGCHFKALVVFEKLLDKEHPDIASSYNNIGIVYDVMGDYDTALEYYFKALTIREKILISGHPDTLQVITTLASLMNIRVLMIKLLNTTLRLWL